MKRISFLCLLLFVGYTLLAQDAVEWRYDRTGIYKETGLLKSWPADGPELLWHYDGLGEGYSSVTISANKIYATGMTDGKGYLYVFDLSGKLLTKKEYGEEWDVSYSGSRGSVIPNEGKLYVISGTGNVICFDQNTLNVVWQKSYTGV